MTSTPVMNSMGSANMNLLNTQPNGVKASNTDFKDLMSKQETATATPGSSKEKLKVKNTPEENKDIEVRKEDAVNTPKEVTDTSKDVNEREASDEDVSQVSEAIEDIKDVIKEELEVSDEDIEKALESLSLTVFALLDKSLLPQIVAIITEKEDVMEIATDENLYESLSNIIGTVQEKNEDVISNLEIEASEFEEAISAFEKVDSDDNAFDEISRASILNQQRETENVDDSEPGFTEKISVTNLETVGKESDTSKLRFENVEKAEFNTTSKKEEVVKLETGGASEMKHESRPDFSKQAMTFAENLLSKVAEVLTEENENISYTSFDAENILNQITEAINVTVSPETSEINLRLHPESLGTVSVKVSANNEGVLTAQFTAQNESVKAIIESQAVMLRETLESKGVTVEAVEVMVQSHGFERNLNDQSRGGREQSESSKRGTRRINLSDPMEDVEKPEEDLVREMMAQSGNTVDYSA